MSQNTEIPPNLHLFFTSRLNRTDSTCPAEVEKTQARQGCSGWMHGRRPTTLMSHTQSIFPLVRCKADMISSGKQATLPVTPRMISWSRPEPAARTIRFADEVIAIS